MNETRMFKVDFGSNVTKRNAAVNQWLRESMRQARPVGMQNSLTWQLDKTRTASYEAAIKRQSVGRWKVTHGNWHEKLQAILAAPGQASEEGGAAQEDLGTAAPGIGLRMIRLIQKVGYPRELAAFVQPGWFYVFDPKTGLWKVPMNESLSWFEQYMDKSYREYADAEFQARIVLPDVTLNWYHQEDLDKWYDSGNPNGQIVNQALIDEAVAKVATALVTGHVALGEIHGKPWAKEVLVGVMEKYPRLVKSIFLEQFRSPQLYVPPKDRESTFTGWKGMGKDRVERLARNFKVITNELTIPVYGFDPRPEFGGVRERPFSIAADGIYGRLKEETYSIAVGSMKTRMSILFDKFPRQTSSDYGSSSDGMRIRNWNMARVFTSLAGDTGSVTLNGSDHLIQDPGKNRNQIKRMHDFLQNLCGIQQVFDFSGIDRTHQVFPGLTRLKTSS